MCHQEFRNSCTADEACCQLNTRSSQHRIGRTPPARGCAVGSPYAMGCSVSAATASASKPLEAFLKGRRVRLRATHEQLHCAPMPLWCPHPSCLCSLECFDTAAAVREHSLLHVAPILAWCGDSELQKLLCTALGRLSEQEAFPETVAAVARKLVNRGKLEALTPAAVLQELHGNSSALAQLQVCLGIAAFGAAEALSQNYDLTVWRERGASVAWEVALHCRQCSIDRTWH